LTQNQLISLFSAHFFTIFTSAVYYAADTYESVLRKRGLDRRAMMALRSPSPEIQRAAVLFLSCVPSLTVRMMSRKQVGVLLGLLSDGD
jgi:hypothetical protein